MGGGTGSCGGYRDYSASLEELANPNFALSFLMDTRNGITHGIQTAFLTSAEKLRGAQLGGAHWADEINGVQAGIYNHSKKINGLQVGLINHACAGNYLQIGLVNSRICSENGGFKLKYSPFFGFGYEKK